MESSRALKRLIRKLTVETLWIYIVRLLMGLGEAKAYDIKKKLYEVFGIKVPAITVYTVVYRMNREGLLEAVKGDGETRYRLTDKGISEFSKAVELLEDIVLKLKG